MAICIAADLLKSKKLKVTVKRELVLSIILESKRPINAKDLHEIASKRDTIDLVTVYRINSLLLSVGLIREIIGDSGTAYYEKACEHNPIHPHFHCSSCGQVYCLEPLSFEEGLILGRVGKGFSITSVSLNIKGVCEKCASLQ